MKKKVVGSIKNHYKDHEDITNVTGGNYTKLMVICLKI
jgi:hypothetical protein